MWTVSPRFLEALRYPHKTVTTCTITPPGGAATTVKVKAGTITVNSKSHVRRQGTVTLEGNSTVFELIATPGATFTIQHGLAFGNSTELIPVFTGEVANPRQEFGDGTITVTLADFGTRVSRNKFPTPYQPAGVTTRVAAISAVATGAITGLSVSTTATDTGTVGDGKLWAENRWDAIRDLTTDAEAEAFFYPDGSFLIRDIPTLTDSPVWIVNAGDGGVLKGAARFRPTNELVNRVTVRPSATDGSQTWAPQSANLADADLRSADRIGVAPVFVDSPTITTAAGALLVAQTKLNQITGMVETLQIDSVANPALECGDVIRVITPNLNREAGRVFQHFIESLSLNLSSGSMFLTTRSQVDVNE